MSPEAAPQTGIGGYSTAAGDTGQQAAIAALHVTASIPNISDPDEAANLLGDTKIASLDGGAALARQRGRGISNVTETTHEYHRH